MAKGRTHYYSSHYYIFLYVNCEHKQMWQDAHLITVASTVQTALRLGQITDPAFISMCPQISQS